VVEKGRATCVLQCLFNCDLEDRGRAAFILKWRFFYRKKIGFLGGGGRGFCSLSAFGGGIYPSLPQESGDC